MEKHCVRKGRRDCRFVPVTGFPQHQMNGSYIPGNCYSQAEDITDIFVDWSNQMPDVRDQGKYGTCYAHCAVEAIESAYKTILNETIRLSAQEIVDREDLGCGVYHGYVGCSFDMIRASDGICFESDYPYVGLNFDFPDTSNFKRGGKIYGYQEIEPNNLELFYKVIRKQPIVVHMRTSIDFKKYRGKEDTFTTPYPVEDLKRRAAAMVEATIAENASPEARERKYCEFLLKEQAESRDHAMMLVGIYKCKDGAYAKLMNSWGRGWGKDGYIVMPLSVATTFGIFENGIFPLLEQALSFETQPAQCDHMDMDIDVGRVQSIMDEETKAWWNSVKEEFHETLEKEWMISADRRTMWKALLGKPLSNDDISKRLIMKLCKKDRVRDIITYPSEVLDNETNMHELFQAWKDEFEIIYKHDYQEEESFEDFKYNVLRYNELNSTGNMNYRLTRHSGVLPGMIKTEMIDHSDITLWPDEIVGVDKKATGGGPIDAFVLTTKNRIFEVKGIAGDAILCGEEGPMVNQEFKRKNKKCMAEKRENGTLSNSTAYYMDLWESVYLQEAKMNNSRIYDVLRFKGSTKVQKLFLNCNAKDLCNHNEAAAYGAAVQADILSTHADDLHLLDGQFLPPGIMTTIQRRSRFAHITSGIGLVSTERATARTKDSNYQEKFVLSGILPAPKGVLEVTFCFDTDANGILNISAIDKFTVAKDKNWLNKEEIGKILRKDEKYKVEDEEQKEKIKSKYALENYPYNKRNTVQNLKIGCELAADKTKLEEAAIQWLNSSRVGKADKVDDKMELEGICNPIVANIYSGESCMGVDIDHDDVLSLDSSGSARSKIEEVNEGV